ncbi:MAG: type 1 glutamine amidotransferase [Rhodothermales bacterium]
MPGFGPADTVQPFTHRNGIPMPYTSFQDIRLLLIQARSAAHMREQELTCFLERCRLRPDQIVPVNVLTESIDGLLEGGFDALMIGGSGECSATEDYAWMPDLLHLVREAYALDLPTFGSCWGHQIIARALGGQVIHDPERTEMGCLEVHLRPAARVDPLFGPFPDRLKVNAGHHDRVLTLPREAIELAYSDSQPNQAFRIAGKPIYGTQFHSELDARRERERLIEYRPFYTEIATEEAFQAIMDSLTDTGEADHLMYDFLRMFVAPHGA